MVGHEKMAKDFSKLCEHIITASLHWTAEDEEKNPMLRNLRTLAGWYLGRIDTSPEDYFDSDVR